MRKFSADDAKERGYRDAYMEAYEDMIQNTTTKAAPWYMVPADNKWFTRVVVAAAVIEALDSLDLHYPEGEVERAGGGKAGVASGKVMWTAWRGAAAGTARARRREFTNGAQSVETLEAIANRSTRPKSRLLRVLGRYMHMRGLPFSQRFAQIAECLIRATDRTRKFGGERVYNFS